MTKNSEKLNKNKKKAEWPTLAFLAFAYAIWVFGTFVFAPVSAILAVLCVAFSVALHSSLTHEVIHGHPFKNARWNAVLVFPAIGLLIPFLRFRDQHLAHHLDADLTDPYDDPESNYLDPLVWNKLPRAVKRVLLFNNTLLGRMIIGTAISQAFFMFHEFRLLNRTIIKGWLWHVPAVALVLCAVLVSPMPIWQYVLAAYIGLSLIKIRTFLEHQAHERASGRTAIIEDRGPLAWLFLNNNLHAVHHAHPSVPWYALPKLYDGHKERFQAMNGGYVYRSYGQVFRRHILKRKDQVPHPFWH